MDWDIAQNEMRQAQLPKMRAHDGFSPIQKQLFFSKPPARGVSHPRHEAGVRPIKPINNNNDDDNNNNDGSSSNVLPSRMKKEDIRISKALRRCLR